MPTRDDALDRLFSSLTGFNRAVRTQATHAHRIHAEMTRPELGTLRIIAACGPCRSSALAEKLGVGASVVSRQLAHFAELGLVRRDPDPDDGRAELVSLTAVGRERMAAGRAAYLRWLSDGLAEWDRVRLTTASAVLDDLAAVLAARSTPDDLLEKDQR